MKSFIKQEKEESATVENFMYGNIIMYNLHVYIYENNLVECRFYLLYKIILHSGIHDPFLSLLWFKFISNNNS